MNTIVRVFNVIFLFLLCCDAMSQQRVDGIVLDSDTRQRVGRVFLMNKTTGANVYNNSKGEFSLEANAGDLLIAKREEYHNDTIAYSGQRVIVFNLKKTSIYIEPVTVVAKKSPEQILAQRKIDYQKAFRLADPGDYFSVGANGAGLSINTIYNLFSKEGKNARKLTAYFQREYEENMVDLKFSRAFVANVTGLQGELLDNFMIRYRPSYAFVQLANTYQMTGYVQTRYEQFKINPSYKPLPNLDEIEIDNKNNEKE